MEDNKFLAHLIFAGVHFIWFVVYYSRFSSENQKISGVLKLQKLNLITDELAALNISGMNQRIVKLKKRCFLPLPFITTAHLFYLYSEKISIVAELVPVLGILAGSALMIAIANVAKGRKVMPDIIFRGDSFH